MDVNNEDETRDPFYEVKGLVTLEDIMGDPRADQMNG